MSALTAKMLDAPIVGGMNESIDPTVLPVDQLQYVQNARMRKPGRLGKRNGYFKVPLTLSGKIRDTAGAAPFTTGLLAGTISGLGDRLIAVQDTAYGYSEAKQTWYDQFAAYSWTGIGSGLAPGTQNSRSPLGHVPGWRPVRASFPGYQEGVRSATVCNCDTEYFDGLHWVASENSAASGATPDVQVVALDPVTDQVIWQQQNAATGMSALPRLLNLGSTLCLLCVDNAGTAIKASQFIGYGAGFSGGLSAGAIVAPVNVGNITGASGFHAVPFSSAQILLAYQSAANTITLKLLTVSATTITVTTTTNYNPAAAGPYLVSVASDPGNGVTLAWRASDGRVYARLFTTGIVASGAEVTMSVGTGNLYRPSVAYGSPGASPALAWNNGPGTIYTAYLSGGASTHRLFVQGNWTLVSGIFYVGTGLYCWAEAETETATSLQRYLFLLKLDDPPNSLYPGAGPDVGYIPGFELTVQDSLVSYAQDITSGSMWLGKTTLGANGYIFAAPFVRATPGTANNTALRLVQANHFSESVRRRSIDVAPARGAQVMAGGALYAAYSTGAYEVGFLNAPKSGSATAGAGGAMTPGGTYTYTFLYRWVNPNGETELSAPSAQFSVTLGGAQNQATIATAASLYALGQKSAVCLDIYRSVLGNVFQYVGTADLNSLTFVDTMSDATAAANAAIYVQVGQELENRAPPACRFLCVSQNRLWCGGLPDPRLIQSSKSFQRGIGIAFADDDSFRVTLPAACTGLAFMDSVVAFTRSAIYIVSGDGPDNSGANGWQPPVALPYQIGCIDWRSVIVSEEGIFFQSDRGLYMLPRGFGEPVPAGDMVMEQLRTYAICTGAAAVTRGENSAGSSAESTIRWAFCQEETCSHGILIVYDRVHKLWSVDALTNPGANQNGPAFLATWSDGFNAITSSSGAPGGRMALALDNTTPQFSAGGFSGAVMREALPSEYANSGFGDAQTVSSVGGAFAMIVRTGQLRPFGLFGHGLVQRVGALVNAVTSAAITVIRTTDRGTGSSSVTPPTTGQTEFVEAAFGSAEQRDLNYVQIEFDQSGTTEGAQFNGFALEIGDYQGMRNQNIGARV